MAKRTAISRTGLNAPLGAPPSGRPSDVEDELPYTVELWTLTRAEVERVLGRAWSAALAQAIFAAAQTEHLGRRITLRHGDNLLSESD